MKIINNGPIKNEIIKRILSKENNIFSPKISAKEVRDIIQRKNINDPLQKREITRNAINSLRKMGLLKTNQENVSLKNLSKQLKGVNQ